MGNTKGIRVPAEKLWWGLWAFLALLVVGVNTPLPAAAALPDGRAYELVSPPDTGSVTPLAAAMGSSDGFDCFETDLATPDGERVTFNSDIGGLEGLAGNGVLNLYEAFRTPSGWVTESKSATGQQTTHPDGGLCLSSDHEYSTLLTGGEPFDKGSLVINGKETSYFRKPDGSFVLAGEGDAGTDQKANIKWISDGGRHIILTSKVRLESNAPTGVGGKTSYITAEPAVNAVYDRTPPGLKVLSLLPNGQAPNSATETTFYRGASTDGSSIVFEVIKSTGPATLYEHSGEGPTVPIASGAATGDYRFGAISADGRRVVYLEEGPAGTSSPPRGSIYLFDASTATSVPVTAGAEAAIINVSKDGQRIYFTSDESLSGSGANPLGATAEAGAPNLYAWDAETESAHYVATVAPADIETVEENLTEWMRTVANSQQGALVGRMEDPSRTTPDGSVFIFQASGNVTGYDSGGHSEVYRYDGTSDELVCMSCPEGAATGNAFLQKGAIPPTIGLSALARIDNVSTDGRTVFFMTGDALVPDDTNEEVDVYEWEGGAVSLITSGKSPVPALLYGMSASGRDVFFLTNDQLVPQDISSVVSLYDARIGGGFPAPGPVSTCEEDQCQGPMGSPIPSPWISSEASIEPPDQAKPTQHHRHKKHRRKRHHRKLQR